MKKIFVLLALCLCCSHSALATESDSHWTEPFIREWQVTGGLTSSYFGDFNHEQTISYGKMGVFYRHVLAFDKESFPTDDPWYQSSFRMMQLLGIFPTDVGIDDLLTREEAASTLYKLLAWNFGFQLDEFLTPHEESLYDDHEDILEENRQVIYDLSFLGVISAKTENDFAPKELLTLGEMAVMASHSTRYLPTFRDNHWASPTEEDFPHGKAQLYDARVLQELLWHLNDILAYYDGEMGDEVLRWNSKEGGIEVFTESGQWSEFYQVLSWKFQDYRSDPAQSEYFQNMEISFSFSTGVFDTGKEFHFAYCENPDIAYYLGVSSDDGYHIPQKDTGIGRYLKSLTPTEDFEPESMVVFLQQVESLFAKEFA